MGTLSLAAGTTFKPGLVLLASVAIIGQDTVIGCLGVFCPLKKAFRNGFGPFFCFLSQGKACSSDHSKRINPHLLVFSTPEGGSATQVLFFSLNRWPNCIVKTFCTAKL